MNYHSAEAFRERQRQRHAVVAPVLPHAVFYHIACMNHWRDVVSEQVRLFAHVGLDKINACALGSLAEVAEAVKIGADCGVRIDIMDYDADLQRCEGITLDRIHEWATENEGAVTYVHTKGVSAQGDGNKEHWRRMMARDAVGEWRRNLRLLELADICGCCWQEDPHWPHFAGNFWAARCDWLRRLERPSSYRLSRDDFSWNGMSWRWRFYAETWLGSKPWHHVESFQHGCHPWTNDVFRRRIDVPGFEYL